MAVPDSTPIDLAEATAPAEGSARTLDLLKLDTARATFVYWASVALVSLSMFVPRLVPLIDYPQHLALADVARRLSDPSAPEAVTHQVNYFTYNGLFHILVAKLSRLMPIELAGRLVVALSLALLGGAVLALVRVLKRPPEYAALATPVLFSFAVGWGFVNYALGTALAFTTAAFVARSLMRPTAASVAFTALFAWLCAMTHVLAMLLLCLFAASLAPEVAYRATRNWLRGLLRSVVALAPLLTGAIWCIAVYREQYAWAPEMYKDATLEGTSPPLWQKFAFFGSWATGVHSDFTDQGLVGIAMIIFVITAIVGFRQRDREDAPLYLPMLAMLGAYLATPMVFIGTHLIFPRLTQAVVIAAVLACPRVLGVGRSRVRVAALTVGAIAGLNLFAHSVLFAYETNDASRVLDDLPEGRRATAVVWGSSTFSFRHGTLVHYAAYYAARKHGDWAFSFARYLSVPVRFKPGGGPAWPLKGWEFAPADYNPRCKYARHFDLVLVKAPRGYPGEQEVRELVFGRDAGAVRLASHHGNYWAFDTKGLPDDGTF